jgi:hypothetical protein
MGVGEWDSTSLRPSFISVNQTRWPPNFVYVLSATDEYIRYDYIRL